MDEQIVHLDKRLTTVEQTVATLSSDAESSRTQQSTIRIELFRLDTRVAVIQSNYATKEDLTALEGKLTGQINGASNHLAERISALEVKFGELEARLLRWTVGAVVAGIGLATGVARMLA